MPKINGAKKQICLKYRLNFCRIYDTIYSYRYGRIAPTDNYAKDRHFLSGGKRNERDGHSGRAQCVLL